MAGPYMLWRTEALAADSPQLVMSSDIGRLTAKVASLQMEVEILGRWASSELGELRAEVDTLRQELRLKKDEEHCGKLKETEAQMEREGKAEQERQEAR